MYFQTTQNQKQVPKTPLVRNISKKLNSDDRNIKAINKIHKKRIFSPLKIPVKQSYDKILLMYKSDDIAQYRDEEEHPTKKADYKETTGDVYKPDDHEQSV